MAIHLLKAIQKVPASLQESWDFFSSPANLQLITPASMRFRVISRHSSTKLYAGQLIEYKVSPLWGIPLYWMTEITQVEVPHYFVDEQRKGPYSFWQHQHHLKAIEGGTEIMDIVHYKVPLGILGDVATGWLVKGKLKDIFTYRFQRVQEQLGNWLAGQEINMVIK